LKAVQQKSSDELKMEVDSSGPALFIPVKPPSFFEQDVEMFDDEEEEQSKEVLTFDTAQSVNDYLDKVINEPESREQAFIMSANWIQLLQALTINLEVAQAAMNFAQTHLSRLDQDRPAILCSLLSCVNGNTVYFKQKYLYTIFKDPAFRTLSINLADEIRRNLSGNKVLMTLLKPFSRTQIRPQHNEALPVDVDVRTKTENGKENEKNGTMEENDKSNADLRVISLTFSF
jgi:hypothetical protein